MVNFLLNIIKVIAFLIYNWKERVLFCLFQLHDQIYKKRPIQNREKLTLAAIVHMIPLYAPHRLCCEEGFLYRLYYIQKSIEYAFEHFWVIQKDQ